MDKGSREKAGSMPSTMTPGILGAHAAAEAPTADERWESEKEEARLIQRSLLPERSLSGETFEVSYHFSPYAEVGGDFADFFMLPDGRMGLYLGDIVGKGLPAALYAALVMGAYRGIHKSDMQAADVLTLLNKRMLVRPVVNRYCATLYATFEPASRVMTFSNAGLPYPLLASRGMSRELGKGGIPSGMFGGVSYDQYSFELAAGDAVLFATDGVHELRNSRNEFLSAEKLGELWGDCGRKTAEESLERLFLGLREFTDGAGQDDDITAVVLKVR
jgi:phosphoserine phosphatase RsbU/P